MTILQLKEALEGLEDHLIVKITLAKSNKAHGIREIAKATTVDSKNQKHNIILIKE